MRVAVRFRWHARKAGGLFLGLRVSFPVRVLYGVDTFGGIEADYFPVQLGLLVMSIEADFFYRFK